MRTVRGLLQVISILALGAWASPSLAQEDINSQIVMTTMTVGVGVACNSRQEDITPASEEILRQLSAAYPEVGARFSSADIAAMITEWVPDAERQLSETGGKFFDKPCSYWLTFSDDIVAGNLALFQPSASQATTTTEEVEEPFDLAGLKQQLVDNVDALPTGQAPELEGCWEATSEGATVDLCLSDAADRVDVVLVGPEGQHCTFDGGVARKNGDGLQFYAFSESGTCSDGTQIQHIEGYCVPDAANLSCLGTVFSESNYILTFGEHGFMIPENTPFHRKG